MLQDGLDPKEKREAQKDAHEVGHRVLDFSLAMDDRQVLHDLRERRERQPAQITTQRNDAFPAGSARSQSTEKTAKMPT